MYAASKQLVLTDGVCNFCNSAVLFIVDRDPKERFVFAQLQSDAGIEALRAHGLGELPLSTMLLIADGQVYMRSDAALQIAKGLAWPWPLAFYVFRWLPRRLRDAAYKYFASHRYAWFGKTEQCIVPTPELRRRMLSA